MTSLHDVVRDLPAALEAAGIDPPWYTTTAEAVRVAVSVSKWGVCVNLCGEHGWGTQVAQHLEDRGFPVDTIDWADLRR